MPLQLCDPRVLSSEHLGWHWPHWEEDRRVRRGRNLRLSKGGRVTVWIRGCLGLICPEAMLLVYAFSLVRRFVLFTAVTYLVTKTSVWSSLMISSDQLARPQIISDHLWWYIFENGLEGMGLIMRLVDMVPSIPPHHTQWSDGVGKQQTTFRTEWNHLVC